ncbi:MAG: ATP-dependent Clp protease ATP-binding subunit [Anaerolineae bacterium]|nr:ATP-dependent Clp protease ATP-binding subunit [Gemmatimonadaceae bacterium]
MMLGDILRPDDAALSRIVRDLTVEARHGRLEVVRCRDDEISRVIDILLRQSKNNPALVGPAGVGKTAIAEGLAQRIVSGDVPAVLRSARLLALDHVALLAGTMYRGQYEERLRSMVAQASADPNIILFVDELHNLIGQGTAMGVAMDAANMLKPALVRGDFRVIGATTSDEYDRWVCGDPALERRFQKISVRELSAEQTLEILEARKDRLERHHNIVIAEDALLAAVRLSDLFITDRARPDRAIDILDEACAHAQARARYSVETEALILERRELLRAGARRAPETREQSGEPASDSAPSPDDQFERFARDGIAALERFGADIEAAFAGQGRQERSTPLGDESVPNRPSHDRARQSDPVVRLASVEWDLQRRFIDEGLIVRGHDVARVVSVATGQRVEWQE